MSKHRRQEELLETIEEMRGKVSTVAWRDRGESTGLATPIRALGRDPLFAGVKCKTALAWRQMAVPPG